MLKLLVIALAVIAVSAEEFRAIVVLQGGGSFVHGNVTFRQIDDGPVTLSGTVTGLSNGLHGFHVHERGDLSGGCISTGGHFNPDKTPHGAPGDEARHVGDLGNIFADGNGVAKVEITDKLITLCAGPNSIVGRAVVVHTGEDDLGKGGKPDSLTTGHAGSRVACGVIGIVSPTGSWPGGHNTAPSTAASLITTALTALSVAFLRI